MIIKISTILFAVAAFVMINPVAYAQSTEIPELFSDILQLKGLSDDISFENIMSPHSKQSHLVNVDVSVLDSGPIQ